MFIQRDRNGKQKLTHQRIVPEPGQSLLYVGPQMLLCPCTLFLKFRFDKEERVPIV